MPAIFAFVLAAAVGMMTSMSQAANIAARDVAGFDGGKVIVVLGDIEIGDDRLFTNLAVQAKGAVVFFNSQGGSVPAAIQIGKAIRLMGFVTVVSDGDTCVSACALAWLGGVARYMGASARVGFHAAYTNTSGEKQVSSVANALIGSYLNGLGYSESAIAYFTSAPPEGVRWLTLGEAGHLGIEVKSLPDSPQRDTTLAPKLAPKNDQLPKSKFDHAKSFVRMFLSASESNNAEDVLRYYAQTVSYSGQIKDKRELSAEQAAYIGRWPYRRFIAPEDEMSITCDSGRCTVSMGVRWLAESIERNKRSTGTAKQSLILQETGEAFLISYFEEKVLERNIVALDQGTTSGQRYGRVFRVIPTVSEGILNMRSGPGRHHDLLASIPAGSENVRQVGPCVEPDDGSSRFNWCNVEWNGRLGWVSMVGLEPQQERFDILTDR